MYMVKQIIPRIKDDNYEKINNFFVCRDFDINKEISDEIKKLSTSELVERIKNISYDNNKK